MDERNGVGEIMYRERPRHGSVSYCPNCCQFGKRASHVAVEGKTAKGVIIALCTSCAPMPARRKTKYHRCQGVFGIFQ
jgi:hypothetical protein